MKKAPVPRMRPIWFALPSLEEFRHVRVPCAQKAELFAATIPGHKAKTASGRLMPKTVKGAWHFANADNATAAEASYYRAYTRAFYAVTYLKGGWDSLRHYEILASGAVPFFLNLTQVLDTPTLWPFPKKAVLSAMALLGPNQTLAVEAAVASQAAPLPAAYPTSFDLERYCELHARLLRHTECFLTTRTLARYVLRESGGLNHRTARVLLFFDTNGQDYMTGLLYHGVFSLLGEARVSSYHGALRHMHLPRMPMATLYGGGFTCLSIEGRTSPQLPQPPLPSTAARPLFLSSPSLLATGTPHGCRSCRRRRPSSARRQSAG